MSSPRSREPRLLAMPRAELMAHVSRYFRHGGGTRPTVALVEVDGSNAVIKDYNDVKGWFAWLIGPILIAREAQALERLADIAAVPALYRRIDRRGLLLEYLPGKPLPQVRPAPKTFTAMASLLETIHTAGVAHCDLRAPNNVLADAAGQPYLVDFAARVCRGRPVNIVWNRIFAAFCQADRNALAKLKVRYAPDQASASERRRAVHRGIGARATRAMGKGVRAFIRLFVRATAR